MKWIVLEDNPKPDNYIGIIMLSDGQPASIDKNTPYSVFFDRQAAISRAFELKERYQVKGIRIFYPEGNSGKIS